jgi:hypothetical protein
VWVMRDILQPGLHARAGRHRKGKIRRQPYAPP